MTGALAAGETWEIYIAGRYDNDVATGYGGGIDALFDAATVETEDTAFTPLNLKLLTVVSVEATAPDTDAPQGYVWGPLSVAAAFGGVVPQNFILIMHNNTGATNETSGNVVNAVGIKFDSA